MTETIVLFEEIEFRQVWVEEEQKWYFAVVDVIKALADTNEPSKYWYNMKRRERGVELSANCRKFRITAPNGRSYQTECADIENLLRIIQSIPSPKAEPFKRWLAEAGRRHLEEWENPELAAQRVRALYKAKGYSNEWIDARLLSINTRTKLTREWKERGVQEGDGFAILIAEISKGAFGVTPSTHKQIKGLKNQELRDHMTDMELILTMLGEAATKEIACNDDAQGFEENMKAALSGGTVAGNARRDIESRTGRPVVSPKNYLNQNQADVLPSGYEPSF